MIKITTLKAAVMSFESVPVPHCSQLVSFLHTGRDLHVIFVSFYPLPANNPFSHKFCCQSPISQVLCFFCQ